jgi:hypothetical protein
MFVVACTVDSGIAVGLLERQETGKKKCERKKRTTFKKST